MLGFKGVQGSPRQHSDPDFVKLFHRDFLRILILDTLPGSKALILTRHNNDCPQFGRWHDTRPLTCLGRGKRAKLSKNAVDLGNFRDCQNIESFQYSAESPENSPKFEPVLAIMSGNFLVVSFQVNQCQCWFLLVLRLSASAAVV